MEKNNATGTDREFEERYLKGVLETVEENCRNLENEVKNRTRTIETLSAQYSDGDLETRDLINSEIHLLELAGKELGKNSRAVKKPYFGRILFNDESLYIGRGGIRKGITEVLVADWRAPISNAYYENGLGEVTFATPDGEKITIDDLNKEFKSKGVLIEKTSTKEVYKWVDKEDSYLEATINSNIEL